MIKNLKKVISTLAAVAILATSASAFAVSFPDVDESASYAGAVEALTTLGVVNGDENGKFNPENTVTRAEFAKMVVEALGAGNEAASSADTKFVDAKGHWAAGYIEVGVAKAFINGYDETTFGPDDQVTYAQAVKMLVAAIGYETYASMQGGWPSGYLAYGSSLDIIAGVSGVTNDTALTRAQCAVLIYNTLKAPICKVDGYEQNYKGEWVPKLTEMNGEGKEWQTLLTTKHDAYVVKGRVQKVNIDAIDGDTVNFRVELAENFENEKVKAYEETVEGTTTVKGAKNIVAYIGESNAADMLFNYAEAIIQKDTDTSEYTVVSITPYGAAKTVEFAAKDIKTPLNADNEIEVKKDNTTKTNDYDVTGAELYVNGYEVVGGYADKATASPAPAYIADNKTGSVTLINATELASTSTDDAYDYVMIKYYVTGVVDSVDADEEEAVVVVNGLGDFAGGDITIDLTEESEQSIKFVKDGAEIAYTDLKEDDILSIAYKYGASDWTTENLEILVSDKTVSGTITGKNTTKETITVDGTVYEYAIGSYNLGTDVTLYLDAFGYVVDKEVNASSKTLGIVAGVYKSAGEYKVKLITADAEVVTYSATTTEAAKIIEKIGETGDEVVAADITPQNAVIEYKVDANGYVKMKNDARELTAGGANQEYSAELSMLGGYSISDTATKIVALGDYFTADGGSVTAMTVDQLEDEAKYEVYVTNDNDGVYGLAIITGDLAALRPTSALAVVTATGTNTTVNDEAVEIVTVAVNGEEDVEVYFEKTQYAGADTTEDDSDDKYLAEGDVIMYTVGTEGYVETGKFEVILAADATANAMYADVFASSVVNFTEAALGNKISYDSTENEYTINVGTPDADKVQVYYGPVYAATDNSLRIFTKKTDGVSSFTNDVKAFSIGNANVYTYNYNKLADEGLRVSTTGLAQDKDFFKVEGQTSYTWGYNVVDGEAAFTTRIQPRMALIRVVDNVVTDVVYYRAK